MVNRNILSLIVFSVLVMGCQGQNPFKRESNPIKKYPQTTANANRPYVAGQRASLPTPPAIRVADDDGGADEKDKCFTPITAKVISKNGESSLNFTEGVETTYDIEVTLGGALNAKDLQGSLPDDSQLTHNTQRDNIHIYKFTWKPAKNSKPSSTMILGFRAKRPAGACPQSKMTAQLDLIVAKDAGAPTVAVSDVKSKIKFGDKFDFRVIVGGTNASDPVIEAIPKSELDLSSAVTKCEASQELEDNQFEYLCHFDSSVLGESVNALVNSGKEVVGTFQVNAGGTPVVQKISVKFEKIEAKKAPAKGAKK